MIFAACCFDDLANGDHISENLIVEAEILYANGAFFGIDQLVKIFWNCGLKNRVKGNLRRNYVKLKLLKIPIVFHAVPRETPQYQCLLLCCSKFRVP